MSRFKSRQTNNHAASDEALETPYRERRIAKVRARLRTALTSCEDEVLLQRGEASQLHDLFSDVLDFMSSHTAPWAIAQVLAQYQRERSNGARHGGNGEAE